MFEKGEYVFYGNKGVCEVMDIATMNLTGVPKDRLFYVLHPYFSKDDKIFTPIDNEKIVIRRLLSKKNAESLIGEIAEIEELQIADEKMREETYKECLRSCECREWVRMIKTLRSRKSIRIQDGKKTTASEDRYLKIVEDYLYSELSILLEMTKQEIAALFGSKLDCNEKRRQ